MVLVMRTGQRWTCCLCDPNNRGFKGQFMCDDGVDCEKAIVEHLCGLIEEGGHGKDARLISKEELPMTRKDGDMVRNGQRPPIRVRYAGPGWKRTEQEFVNGR